MRDGFRSRSICFVASWALGIDSSSASIDSAYGTARLSEHVGPGRGAGMSRLLLHVVLAAGAE